MTVKQKPLLHCTQLRPLICPNTKDTSRPTRPTSSAIADELGRKVSAANWRSVESDRCYESRNSLSRIMPQPKYSSCLLNYYRLYQSKLLYFSSSTPSNLCPSSFFTSTHRAIPTCEYRSSVGSIPMQQTVASLAQCGAIKPATGFPPRVVNQLPEQYSSR